jgi:hypothetical protein
MIVAEHYAEIDGRPHGTCNYSGYPEYDSLTGYVTGTYSREWNDKKGNRWRKTVTIINLGRPDRGIAADDVDEAMSPEPLPYERPSFTDSYRSAIIANAERKHSKALELYKAYMLEHGPAPVRDLLRVAEWHNKQQVYKHLRLFPDVYRSFPGNPQAWGLHGQQAKKSRPVYSGLPKLMRDALIEHGVMTANELAAILGYKADTCRQSLCQRENMFVRVRREPRPESKVLSVIWGVRGVHGEGMA